MARECDLVLVIGSRNSSNSNRLVDVARDMGTEAHLIDNEAQVRDEWLEGKRVVGITSGASAPEELVQRLVDFFRARGTKDVSRVPHDARGRALHAAEDDPARRWRRRAARSVSRAQPGADVVAVLVEARRAPRDRRALAVEAQRRRRQRHAVGLGDRL